jgi:Undecaprenyl-phosphate glucose phosphotransferase
MFRRHRQVILLAFLSSDLITTTLAWFGAYFVRFACWPAPDGVPRLTTVAVGLPWVLVVAILAYKLCGLYDVHRLRRFAPELSGVFFASGLLFLLTITITFYRRDLYESRLALGLFLLLAALLLIGSRRLLWWALQHYRSRYSGRHRALIVGSGRTGRNVAATIRANRWTGLEVVGYVDRPAKVDRDQTPLLGDVDDLQELVAKHGVDHVFVALPAKRYEELPRIHEMLSHVLVDVQFVPDLPNLSGMRVRSLEVDGLTFLSLRENPHVGWHRVAKRSMDLVLGSAALVLLSPLMLLAAIVIKLTSRGPVFYRQPRLGVEGKPFNILKFRTMCVNAESQTGPVWARRGDRRVTLCGRFLRRSGIDELPQLFNVLAGDMSLVGPRPERGVFIEQFQKQIPNYAQRHQVKSGITGWAQVNGWRGNTSLRRRIECDLYYICNWSLWFDVQILIMTLFRGVWHKNAC